MKRLWARVGMSVQLTDDEYDQFKKLMNETESTDLPNKIASLFEWRGKIDGDSYIPIGCDDNPNEYDIEF